MLAIYFGSDQDRLPGPEGIPFFDKFAHFGAYGLLGTLWARALGHGGASWRTVIWAAVIASVYGATDELHQSFNPGRSVEFADWVADTAGAALAVGLYCFWPTYRKVMDHPIGRRSRGASPATVPAAVPEQHP